MGDSQQQRRVKLQRLDLSQCWPKKSAGFSPGDLDRYCVRPGTCRDGLFFSHQIVFERIVVAGCLELIPEAILPCSSKVCAALRLCADDTNYQGLWRKRYRKYGIMLSLHRAFDVCHVTAVVNHPYPSAAVYAAETIVNNSLYATSQLRDLSMWTVAVCDEYSRPLTFVWRARARKLGYCKVCKRRPIRYDVDEGELICAWVLHCIRVLSGPGADFANQSVIACPAGNQKIRVLLRHF